MSEAPSGFTKHTEGSSTILLPAPDPSSGQSSVFLNPAQQYNRDLSIVAIRTWSEVWAREDAERKERAKQRKAERPSKKRKLEHTPNGEIGAASTSDISASSAAPHVNGDAMDAEPVSSPPAKVNGHSTPTPKRTFTCFEGLAASGLRSIRYAKEIPLLRWVIANDLSASAVKSIHEHIALNGIKPEDGSPGKVRPQEGDCTDTMYAHRAEKKRFDVVDLDPYGTAAPFFDAAVQAVRLLCVTCTDMAVLAGAQYPEKSFSNYGGIPIKGEFSHETALRLVLNGISTCAIRYGRHIQPLLSLSIDFYVRVFVRVYSSPVGAKRASTSTGVVYACHGCHAIHTQKMARLAPNTTDERSASYRAAVGPPVGKHCEECGSTFAFGGPLWLDSLHDRAFVQEMLDHVNSSEAAYGTLARLKGMLAVAKSEIDAPFYFTPSRAASTFQCTAPSLSALCSAFLHAGYDVSRSHAAAGSIKTNAPASVLHDIMRAWIVDHPVKMENIKEGNPARLLLAKQSTLTDISFKEHPALEEKMLTAVKIARYQEQPAGHGPMATAKGGKGKRRKP